MFSCIAGVFFRFITPSKKKCNRHRRFFKLWNIFLLLTHRRCISVGSKLLPTMSVEKAILSSLAVGDGYILLVPSKDIIINLFYLVFIFFLYAGLLLWFAHYCIFLSCCTLFCVIFNIARVRIRIWIRMDCHDFASLDLDPQFLCESGSKHLKNAGKGLLFHDFDVYFFRDFDVFFSPKRKKNFDFELKISQNLLGSRSVFFLSWIWIRIGKIFIWILTPAIYSLFGFKFNGFKFPP